MTEEQRRSVGTGIEYLPHVEEYEWEEKRKREKKRAEGFL
jgi:hypothetical protein